MNDPAPAQAAPRPKKPAPTRQHRGRILALQVLFEADVTGHRWGEALRAHAEAVAAPNAVTAFAEERVAGVLEAVEAIDEVIRRLAPAWPLDQVPAVDRNILRIALYELRPGSPTPPKVVINEAVELAKEFGGEGSSRFVNGVLGAAVGGERPPQPPTG